MSCDCNASHNIYRTHTHSSLKLKYCIKYYGVCVVSGITLVVMVQFGSVTLGVGVVCRVVSLSKG